MLENTFVHSLHFNLFSLPVILAGCITMGLGLYAWPKGNNQGERYFSFLMIACTIYALFYTLEICSSELPLMTFFLRLEYIGAVALGPLIWVFTCKYADRTSFLTVRNHLLLFAFPVFLLIMVFTNNQHHWFYTEFRRSYNGFFYVLDSSKGFLYWVHQAYSIFWIFLSNLMLIKMIQNVPRSYRNQVLMVLIGSLSSWTAYFLHLMHLIPLDLDAVPFAFAVSGIIIYLGLFQFGLFSMIPVAYKSLFENMTDGVLVTDAAGFLVASNKSAVKILGLNPSSLGRPTGISLAQWPELLTLNNPTPERLNIEIFRGLGRDQLWLSVDCTPNLNNDVLLGNIVFLRDITEKKRAEISIKEQQQELDLFFNNALSGAFFMMLDQPIVWNDDSDKEKILEYVFQNQRITRVNQAMLDQYGAKKSDLLSYRPLDFFSGDKQKAKTVWVGLFDQGRQKVEIIERKIDGSEVIFEGDYVCLYDEQGRITGHFGIQQDITERKKAQSALITSENRAQALAKQYKSILDSQSVYVLKTDLAGNYTYINDYFLQRFAPEGNSHLLGRYFSDIVVEEDHPKLRKAVESCFFQPETPHEVILKKPTVDGLVKAGKWEFKGILDKKGNLDEILCIGFDITEQVENLEKANELLQVISEQNTKLKSFTYIVSHNIRSHSSNLSGLIQVLKSSPTEDDRIAFFNMLEISTNRLDETIRNLNEIIQISENTAKEKSLKLLKQEVNKTLNILNGVIAKNDIQVLVDIPAELSICIVDTYLDSILLNLLSNAIKYRSTNRSSSIQIHAQKEAAYVVLAIKDNGLGLNLAKYGDKIFGMYKTFHRNEDARGFGLFITKTQIEAMGGKITVESVEGEGSVFKVFFQAKE